MTIAGTYKANRDMMLLLWDPCWADEYVANYLATLKKEALPHPIRYPIGYQVKKDQELSVEFGARRPLLKDIGEHKSIVNAIDITVKVGSKIYSGIGLTYNDYNPAVVNDDSWLRAVKKRNK